MRRVYLAGPITGLDYNQSVNWRDYAIAELGKVGVLGVSPMRAKDGLRRENKISDSYENFPLSSQKGIVARDRFDVGFNCDILLANLLGAEKVSIGTIIEYGWADAFRKPIITIIEKQGNPHNHSMIRELSGFTVDTLEEGLSIAKAILTP